LFFSWVGTDLLHDPFEKKTIHSCENSVLVMIGTFGCYVTIHLLSHLCPQMKTEQSLPRKKSHDFILKWKRRKTIHLSLFVCVCVCVCRVYLKKHTPPALLCNSHYIRWFKEDNMLQKKTNNSNRLCLFLFVFFSEFYIIVCDIHFVFWNSMNHNDDESIIFDIYIYVPRV
jgi:hypothetical protein